MAEYQLITLDETRNDNLREKLGGLFVSMEKNLSVQTKTLDGMYKLQVRRYTEENERYRDEKRQERLSPEVSDEVEPQTPQVKNDTDTDGDGKGTATAIGALLTSVIGGLSVAGIVKTMVGLGWRSLIATAIGSFITESVQNFLDDPDTEENEGETGWRKEFADALGTAATWGIIGSIFGRRIGIAAAAGAFAFNFTDDVISMINEEFNTNLDPEFWAYIGAGISSILALWLPGAIFRRISAGLAGMRRPPVPNGNPTGTGQGGRVPPPTGTTREALLRNLPDDELQNRGIVRSINQQNGRVTYNYGGPNANGRTGAVSNAALQSMLQDVENASANRVSASNAKLGAVMRALSVAGMAYSAYQLYQIHEGLGDYEGLNQEQKAEATGSVLGGLFGGIGGGALAAVLLGALGSAVPVGGTIAGLIAGGVLGSFAGSYLGQEIGAFLYSGTESPAQLDAAMAAFDGLAEDRTMEDGSPGMYVYPRPTGQEEGDPYGIQHLEQQVENFGSSNPTWARMLAERQVTLEADQSAWDEMFGGRNVPVEGGLVPLSDLNLTPEEQAIFDSTPQLSPSEMSDAGAVLAMGDALAARSDQRLATLQQNLIERATRTPSVILSGGSPISAPTYTNNTTNIFQTIDHSSALGNTHGLPFR